MRLIPTYKSCYIPDSIVRSVVALDGTQGYSFNKLEGIKRDSAYHLIRNQLATGDITTWKPKN